MPYSEVTNLMTMPYSEVNQHSLTRKIKDKLGTIIGKIDSKIILLEDLYYRQGGGKLYDYPYILFKINNGALENSLIKNKVPKEDCNVKNTYTIAKFPKQPNSVELLVIADMNIPNEGWYLRNDVIKNLYLDESNLLLKEKIKQYIDMVCKRSMNILQEYVLSSVEKSVNQNPNLFPSKRLELTMVVGRDPIINLTIYILDVLLGYSKMNEDDCYFNLAKTLRDIFNDDPKVSLAFSTQKHLAMIPSYLVSQKPGKGHRKFNFKMCYSYIFGYIYVYVTSFFPDFKRYPNRTFFGQYPHIFDKDVYTAHISKMLNDVLYHITDGYLEYQCNNEMVTLYKGPNTYPLVNLNREDVNKILDYAMFHLAMISMLNWNKVSNLVHKNLKRKFLAQRQIKCNKNHKCLRSKNCLKPKFKRLNKDYLGWHRDAKSQ